MIGLGADLGFQMPRTPHCCLGWDSDDICRPPGTKGHQRGLLVCHSRGGWDCSKAEGRLGCGRPSPCPTLASRVRASPFLRLVDDVADLHVEGPVLTLQGAICRLLCGEETISHGVWTPRQTNLAVCRARAGRAREEEDDGWFLGTQEGPRGCKRLPTLSRFVI